MSVRIEQCANPLALGGGSNCNPVEIERAVCSRRRADAVVTDHQSPIIMDKDDVVLLIRLREDDIDEFKGNRDLFGSEKAGRDQQPAQRLPVFPLQWLNRTHNLGLRSSADSTIFATIWGNVSPYDFAERAKPASSEISGLGFTSSTYGTPSFVNRKSTRA